jgi:hypothetical protein
MSGDFLTIAAARAAGLLDFPDRLGVRVAGRCVTGAAVRTACDSGRGQAIEMAGRLAADRFSMVAGSVKGWVGSASSFLSRCVSAAPKPSVTHRQAGD